MRAILLWSGLWMAVPSQDEWKAELLDVRIPMRDGKDLAADVYLPPKPGRYPAVLIQTPYNKRHLGAPIGTGRGDGGEVGRGAVSDTLGLLDREHYAYVVVDWRGFFGSKAAMEGVSREKWRRGQDGYDCVEWAAAQPWSDGKVGTWGGSALGKQQLDTALEHPPHLVCCVPLIAALGQEYSFYYPGGVLLEAHVKTLDVLGFGVSRMVLAQPREDAPVWKLAGRATYRPQEIQVPLLMITGWWDHFPDQIVRTFEDIVSRGGRQAREHSRLLIGPWDHVGVGLSKQGDRSFPGAERASAEAAKAFFDRWLRGADNGWDRAPRVRWWRINEEGWGEAESWSGLRRETRAVPLGGGDRTYACDPRDPSPTLGGANLPPLKHGPTDHSALERRKDVLAFSVSLDKPERVNGAAELSFEATVDRPSCDFIARLCDVVDGKPMHLADAVRRVRPVPGERTRVRLRFPATAVTARELRVYLSCSNWPRYERNPHTGADHWDEKAALPAAVTVHGGAELSLPIEK